MKFKHTGYIVCKFGKTTVFMYNFNRSSSQNQNEFQESKSIKRILLLLIQALRSNIELLFSLMIILFQTINGGLINLIINGVILFFILIEENLGLSFWWNLLYIFYLVIILLRRVLMLGIDYNRNRATLDFFIGADNSYITMLIPIMIIVLVETLKRSGFGRSTILKFENPGGAIA